MTNSRSNARRGVQGTHNPQRTKGSGKDGSASRRVILGQLAARSAAAYPGLADQAGIAALAPVVGNRAVQRLLASRNQPAVQLMPLSPEGAHAAQLGPPERGELLGRLIAGEEINTYTNGICYDTVAFAKYLQGAIAPGDLTTINGIGWLGVLNFESHNRWQGGAIPEGSAVGFKNVDGDFFHASLAVGGTTVRGVNGGLLGAGWTVPADIAEVLVPAGEPGVYTYDRRPIEVWYW